MPTPPRSDTAERILDSAELFIQTRGYSAISYQHISDALGIRKASIHYHYPTKAELGAAVMDRYTNRLRNIMDDLLANDELSSMAILTHYFEPYAAFAQTPDKICLFGALAGEILALPGEIRQRVKAFVHYNEEWLSRLLARGADRSEFAIATDSQTQARYVFAALQGALLVKRVTGNADRLFDVIAILKRQLTGPCTTG